MKMSQWRIFSIIIISLLFACYGCTNDDDDSETDTSGAGDNKGNGLPSGDADSDSDSDSDTDSDSDSDTDEGTDSEDDNCPDCVGGECSESTSCCEGAVCSSELYSGEGFIGHYCYVECNALTPETPCECAGEECIGLEGTNGLCLDMGFARKENMRLKILTEEYMDTVLDNQTLALQVISGNLAINAKLGKQNIPLSQGLAYQTKADLTGNGVEEDFIIMQLMGLAGMSDYWTMLVVIPQEKFVAGATLQSVYTDATGQQQWDFDCLLQLGKINAASQYTSMASMGILLSESTLTVNNVGEYCSSLPCPSANISLDAQFAAIKADLELPEE